MAELARLLLSPKRLVILIMAAVINLALFSGYCRDKQEQSIAKYSTGMQSAASAKSRENQKLQQYLEKDYPDYLKYVEEQAAAQSILSGLTKQSGFIDRNLKKTAADYSRLEGITLTAGESRGILAVADYPITDYLLLIAPILLVLELLADADSAAGDLTRSTRQGRVPLCAWRIAAVALNAAASVLLLYGGNILYTCIFYGNPGLTRALQSIPEYQVCVHRITVGGYLLAAGCLKTLAAVILALLIWLVLSRFHVILGWLISGIWIGASFLLFRLIVPTAGVNHLKFLNVFAALDADIFFTQYCNLNWFGYPAGFLLNTLVFCIILLTVSVLLCLLRIGHAYPAKTGERLADLSDRLHRFLTRHLPVHSLFGMEGWKLMIAQKGLFILLAAGVMGFSLWKEIHVYVPVNSDTERFYSQYSGEVTKENIERTAYIVIGEMKSLKNAKVALAKAYLRKAAPRDIDRIKQGIQKSESELYLYKNLLNTMLMLAKYTRETGRPAWFIQQNAYMVFFQDSAAEHRCSMVLLLWMIFTFSGIAAYDNRYDTAMLLRSTRNGRAGLLTAKAGWILLLTLLASFGLHGVYLAHFFTDAEFAMLDAPAQSLALFRDLPFSVSMRGILIGYLFVRYLIALVIAAGIYAVSRFSRTPEKARMTAMVIFLLPSALAESGIEQLQLLNCVRLLSFPIA